MNLDRCILYDTLPDIRNGMLPATMRFRRGLVTCGQRYRYRRQVGGGRCNLPATIGSFDRSEGARDTFYVAGHGSFAQQRGSSFRGFVVITIFPALPGFSDEVRRRSAKSPRQRARK